LRRVDGDEGGVYSRLAQELGPGDEKEGVQFEENIHDRTKW